MLYKMYKCEACKFTTINKNHFNRHTNTSKHKEKLANENLCHGCFKEFFNKYNKLRHEKKCKEKLTGDTVGNNSPITSTEINGDVINSTINNITVNVTGESKETLESFVITIKDLMKKTKCDYYDKLILKDMLESNRDIMDFVDKFDDKFQPIVKMFDNDHKSCSSEDNKCFHTMMEFKIQADHVIKAFIQTIMDFSEDFGLPIYHVTKDMDGKNKQIVFKYLTELHDENVLKDFLSRSKYSDRIDIDTTTKQITSDPKFKLEYANFQAKLYKKTKSAHKVKK